MLQIFEDGRLTDSTGRVINFKNTIIIMTSNIGARLITDKKFLGFSKSEEKDINIKEYEETKKEVLAELKKELKPEFINRIDEIVVFHKLNDNEISKIVDIMLEDVIKRLKKEKYLIEIDKDVKNTIIEKGIDKSFGARPLRRTIQNLLENLIAEKILEGNIQKGKLAKIITKENDLFINF